MKTILLLLISLSMSFSHAKINKISTKSLITERIEKKLSKELSKKDLTLVKKEVIKYKGKSVPALVNVMKNDKFPDKNRWLATFLLGRVMGKKSIPFITKFTEHPNWVLRLASMKSLLALGEKNKSLYKRGLKDPSMLVRYQSLENIKDLGMSELAPSVWSMLYDKRNYYSGKNVKTKRQHIVKKVVKTIGDLKFKKAEKPLIKMILDKKYEDILPEMNYALSKITEKKAPQENKSLIKRFWKKHQIAQMTF